jgi:glycosyltransferase involved in cell wall biosynthesis
MKIGVSAPYRMHGGGLVHLTQLLNVWVSAGVDREHTITLFTRRENMQSLCLTRSAIRFTPIAEQEVSTVAKLVWEQCIFPSIIKKAQLDVLFCPGGIVPFASPVPTVVAVRNAAPFCMKEIRSLALSDRAYFNALRPLVRLSQRCAARVIFISHFLKSVFVMRYGFSPDRGDVIYHGRNGLEKTRECPAALSALGIRPPFCLSVSHLYPYKNYGALIEGYARAGLKDRGLRLVIVGKATNGQHYEYLDHLVRRLGLESWVLFPGAVPHEVIRTLLAACEFFVFQSTCENCPNTLIEALAQPVPIACSNAGVMPEIAGDAALYFDPYDPAVIAQQLRKLADDYSVRAELRTRARGQALKFPTWEEVGRLTLDSLARAL